VCISNLFQSLPRQIRHVIKAIGNVTKYWMFGGYNFIYYEVIASQTSTNCNRLTWRDVVNVKYFCHIMYPTVTSARSCNKVDHLFWFTILAQHETNDVILYIHIYSVHKHWGNTFQRQNYKMRLKQRSLNLINSMQVKKILFTNVFFSWSLCLLNMFPSMVFPKQNCIVTTLW
jgi:hypothetical protein